MEQSFQALKALLAERQVNAPHIGEDTLRMIFQIEEQVQFDGDRPDAPSKLRDVVQAAVEKLLNG